MFGAALLDFVHGVFHLLVEVFAEADERVEARLATIEKQLALGLDEFALNVDSFEVDGKTCYDKGRDD